MTSSFTGALSSKLREYFNNNHIFYLEETLKGCHKEYNALGNSPEDQKKKISLEKAIKVVESELEGIRAS